MAELLGVRADPVGTPWGVSALIVGGARIRADMRLRSKQQRRVMNAEFSNNGIYLACVILASGLVLGGARTP